jgi:hypothetical protein
MIYITCEQIYVTVVVVTLDMLCYTWDEIKMIHIILYIVIWYVYSVCHIHVVEGGSERLVSFPQILL